MSPRVVCIVQARMGSTRLPGKVLLPVLDRPMLAHQLDRLHRCHSLDEVVVATSIAPADDAIRNFLAEQGDTPCHRGSEDDVLDRFHTAAIREDADVVVRSTADCPLIDPDVVDLAVDTFLADPSVDYVSNSLQRTYPQGLDVEVFSMETLAAANAEATTQVEREHVTPFIYLRPERFNIQQIKDAVDRSHLRWTVDTDADLTLVREIYGALYPERPDFRYADVLALLESRPELSNINADVVQKKLGD